MRGDIRTRVTCGGDGYELTIETDDRPEDDGSRREIVTDWYFSANDRVARVCRYERIEDSFLTWMFQYRPDPTRNSRHGKQFDSWTRLPRRDVLWTPVPSEVERELWRQAHAAALAWVLRKEIIQGGLWGWQECTNRPEFHRAVMGPAANPNARVRRSKR